MTDTLQPPVTACPCCGAASLRPIQTLSALLAVCDVLVVKALEACGKRIVHVSRSRYRELGDNPFHVAHTIWRPDQTMIRKSLESAWDVVPALLDEHGCCGITSRQVAGMLSRYTDDLLTTGTEHSITELRIYFDQSLGIHMRPHPSEMVSDVQAV